MKNPNKIQNYKKPLKALVTVSALAVATSGIAVSEAGASSNPTQKAPISVEHNSSQNETPLRALTKVIAGLERGKPAEVAGNVINVPGPIGEAKGQPLVFSANGSTYFAFTQEQEPNFNQKQPADIASDMAIVRESTSTANMPLEEAHLDKSGILVDEDQIAVGYSTGGDSGK